jgi:FkbM family methyltransferase
MWKARQIIARELHRRGIYRIGADPFSAIDKDLLFHRFGITLVFDVGANAGGWGKHLRYLGYSGRIISLEPASEPFGALALKASDDPLWDVHQLGAGDADRVETLNIASSSVSNSLLAYAGAVASRQEAVRVCRLDTFADQVEVEDHVWVKIDVEGYELAAIAGATELLARTDCVEIELTTKRIYAGEALFYEVAPALYELNFELVAVASAAVAPSGRTVRFDALFARPDEMCDT